MNTLFPRLKFMTTGMMVHTGTVKLALVEQSSVKNDEFIQEQRMEAVP